MTVANTTHTRPYQQVLDRRSCIAQEGFSPFTLFRQKKEIKALCQNFLLSQFTDEAKRSIAERKWRSILRQACQNIGESHHLPTTFLQKTTLEKLLAELQEVVVSIVPENIALFDSDTASENVAENILKYLFSRLSDPHKLVTKEAFRNTFVKEDPEVFASVRKEFSQVFLRLFEQIEQNDYDDIAIEMLIGSFLSFYPMFSPEDGEEIELIQKIDGHFQLVPYTVSRISLTPQKNKGAVFAYGLRPQNDQAQALLLFRGTPHPAAKGFGLSIVADFLPFSSVGKLLFKSGKKAISSWLEETKEATGKKVAIYGVSLGGALVYHVAKAFPEFVDAYAYAAPGLFGKNRGNTSSVNKSFFHSKDLVWRLDTLPLGFLHHKVVTVGKRTMYDAHIRSYADDAFLLLRVNPKQENTSLIRRVITVLHKVFSPLIFLLTMIVILIKKGVALIKKGVERGAGKIKRVIGHISKTISRHRASGAPIRRASVIL